MREPNGIRKSSLLRALLTIVMVGAAIAILLSIQALAEVISRHRAMVAEHAPPPPGMVMVPAGWFVMGTDDVDAGQESRPMRRVFLPAYYIDVHEVTNAEYQAVVPEHTFPEGAADVPVTHVLRHEAAAYAAAVGKRLPTNAEWEKAARGTDGRQYPWGDEFRPECANIGRLSEGDLRDLAQRGVSCGILGPRVKVTPGSYPCGASPYGVMDMAGNVWEWAADSYRDRRYWWQFWIKPIERGVIRGGAYGYGPAAALTWAMAFEGIQTTCNDVGFCCVMDAAPAR